MLTVSQLSKSFSGRILFDDVSLQVNRGDRIGLVGPNGAGKSTLFSLILGEASHIFDEHGGWELEPKAKRVLAGLAFRETDFDRPAQAISGGWIMRAHLARLAGNGTRSSSAR
jgi:ATP-binding cassette subfamily F protein 3